MIITPEELKNTVLNANVDDEYINPAINEAEDIYLREILGDKLYNTVLNAVGGESIPEPYLTLVNTYIKPYLTYMVQSLICIPVQYKIRNAGIVSQYDQGFTTSNVKDTAYLKEYYDSKAQFYGNRLTVYLQKNSDSFPDYDYDDENVTQPTISQNVTTLYLGTRKRKPCCKK